MGPDNFLTDRMHGFGTTIFAEMSALAVETGSINLGQGFPDTDGPSEVLEAAVAAIRSGHNQYPPGPGIAELRQAVARHQSRFYRQSFDPDREVLITTGATEAIAASLLALCQPGDEVLTFEPYYDSYAASIALAGATRRVVPLVYPELTLDTDALRAAVSPATRLILLNSPHNPTGKVFSADELAAIAAVAVENDLLVVSDEVYEHLVFDHHVHVPIATLPGMAERTVTIGSAGKTFSVTGWKIGWACARPDLLAAVRTVKQFLTYVSGGPFQPAVARALDLGDDYFAQAASSLQAKRDRLVAGLREAGFDPFVPEGTYFVTVDIAASGFDDGIEFCRVLPQRCGVVAVPTQVFYDDAERGRSLVRFAFCKSDEVLDEACRRLSSWEV